MKVVILGDLHLASKNGSKIVSTHQQKFFDNILFPFLKATGYEVLQLGDLFDQRKYVNFVGLESSFDGFFDRLPTRMTTLLGNHDISYRETLRVNSPELLLRGYDNIEVISYPQAINGIDYIPWICDENRKEVETYIRKSKNKICLGHFEIAGFAMYRGVQSHGGMDVKMFKKYDLVLSGHYHTKSMRENIAYVGTPYELTWSDFNDPKGFHILDTETLDMEFVENPHTLYATINYDDREKMDWNPDDYFEKYVKVIVINKSDYFKFDQFISELGKAGTYDIKILENFIERAVGEIGDEVLLQDTLEVLDSYISSLEVEEESKLKTYMKSLHTQAGEIL